MLGSDGEPSRLKTDRRDGARGREGKDNLSGAIKSTFESRPAQLRKAPDCAYTRDGLHDVLRIESIPFFFLTLPRNEQVSNEMFARTGFPE